MYLHPYDLDPQPYPNFQMAWLALASLKRRLRMRSFWLRRKSLFQQYDQLLSEFHFKPTGELVEALARGGAGAASSDAEKCTGLMEADR